MNIQPSRAINEEGIQGARIFCPHCDTATVYILIPAAATDTIEETPRPAADDQPCWCGALPGGREAVYTYYGRHQRAGQMPPCPPAEAAVKRYRALVRKRKIQAEEAATPNQENSDPARPPGGSPAEPPANSPEEATPPYYT